MLQQTAEKIMESVEPVVRGKSLRKTETAPTRQTFTDEDFDRIRGAYAKAVRVFLTGEGKISETGPYKIIFRGFSKELWFIRQRLRSNAVRKSYNRSLVAKEINGVYFGNSTELWARRNRRSSDRFAKQLNIQRDLSEVLPMVPFSLFEEHKLNINKLEIVEKGPQEDLDFGRKNKDGKTVLQHFTGALLFKIESSYFLFDLDRNEVPKKQFNAWMSKLPRACTSISDGYASLKPSEVYEAEKFLGHEVQRQGEWFFIPVQGEFKKDEDRMTAWDGWGVNRTRVASLQANGNRAHLVSFMSKEGYVKGKVTHEGYEHKPITLETWCKPVPNAATESFKISGAVD